MIFLALPDLETDDDLLLALMAGTSSAVDDVYAVYFSPLYNYVRLKVGDAALAEDIVSEVFVKLLRVNGTRSAPRTSLRGWLFQVARNEIASVYRKRIPMTELEDWMPATDTTNPETTVAALFEIQQVRGAMQSLKNEHQEVLILRFGQQLSLQDTAEIMGKSVSAIKSLQFRALDALRNTLITKGVRHA